MIQFRTFPVLAQRPSRKYQLTLKLLQSIESERNSDKNVENYDQLSLTRAIFGDEIRDFFSMCMCLKTQYEEMNKGRRLQS